MTRIVEVLRPGATIGEVLDAAEVITDSGFDIWDDLVHGFGGAYLPPIVRTRANRGATHPDDFEYPDGTLLVVQPNVIDGLGRGPDGQQPPDHARRRRSAPSVNRRE